MLLGYDKRGNFAVNYKKGSFGLDAGDYEKFLLWGSGKNTVTSNYPARGKPRPDIFFLIGIGKKITKLHGLAMHVMSLKIVQQSISISRWLQGCNTFNRDKVVFPSSLIS